VCWIFPGDIFFIFHFFGLEGEKGNSVPESCTVPVVEADKRELQVKKSAPNDNVKIGYYSIFLLSNDRKRSYESIGMVIY
jgi:hypothetical protein